MRRSSLIGIEITFTPPKKRKWYSLAVQISLNIRDEIAARLGVNSEGAERVVLEALAADGYRTERLTEFEVRQLLGFETRMEVHAFLKERGAFLHYSETEMEKDRESAERMRAKRRELISQSGRRTA